jgi:hypothetical protein
MCQLIHSTRRIALGVPSEIDVLKPWPTISLRSGDYVCRQLNAEPLASEQFQKKSSWNAIPQNDGQGHLF